VTPEGGRLTYAGLRSIVRRRARAAGLSVPSLHSFRRAFALGMLKGGADILSISRLLGHADLSLPQRYIRQMVDDLAAVHRRAGPVDKLLAFMLCLLTALWMKP
jgi:integrase/recombinase XerD